MTGRAFWPDAGVLVQAHGGSRSAGARARPLPSARCRRDPCPAAALPAMPQLAGRRSFCRPDLACHPGRPPGCASACGAGRARVKAAHFCASPSVLSGRSAREAAADADSIHRMMADAAGTMSVRKGGGGMVWDASEAAVRALADKGHRGDGKPSAEEHLAVQTPKVSTGGLSLAA